MIPFVLCHEGKQRLLQSRFNTERKFRILNIHNETWLSYSTRIMGFGFDSARLSIPPFFASPIPLCEVGALPAQLFVPATELWIPISSPSSPPPIGKTHASCWALRFRVILSMKLHRGVGGDKVCDVITVIIVICSVNACAYVSIRTQV